MAFDEEKHRKIEDYLHHTLRGESRKKFEQDMQADDQLRKEVELHRDMEEFLSDSPENALRKNLRLLGKEASSSSTPKSNWWAITVLIPILLVLVWWSWSGRNDKQSPDTGATPIEEKIIPTSPNEGVSPAPVQKPPVDQPEREEAEPQPSTPPSPPPSPGRKRGQREPAPRAIAANFVPNPSLEFLIENNLRDAALGVKFTKKQKDIQLTATDNLSPFQVKVQLRSSADISQQDFKLHLFSNDRQAFDDFTPINTSDLTITPIEEDIYEIDFTKSYSLKPGLYYYVIEDFSQEKIHLVEKFEVK